MNITYKIVKMTPPKAKTILKNNPKNRSIHEGQVSFLADQMRKGRFLQNGDCIVISETNALIDGQHRLHALIQADMTLPITVCRGVKDVVIKTIDSGHKRTLANMFEMEGHRYFSHKAAFATALLRYKKKMFHRDAGFISKNSVLPSMEDRYTFYMKYQKAADKWIKYVINSKKFIDFNPTNLAMALFLIEKVHKESAVNDFLDKMLHGGDYKYSPTLAIPQIIRLRKREDVILHRFEHFYLLLHGFELWLNKEPLVTIQIKELRKIAPTFYDIYKIN